MPQHEESEICEVELLHAPLMITFPPQHLGAREKSDDIKPYEEHLDVSVWLKYATDSNALDRNWNWVPLALWLQHNNGKLFDAEGTLEELRDLITQRALKEPFDIGLDVREITVEVVRTTDGIRPLQRALKAVSIETTQHGPETAIIRHTVYNPSQEHWCFDESPELKRGKFCPRPFALVDLAA